MQVPYSWGERAQQGLHLQEAHVLRSSLLPPLHGQLADLLLRQQVLQKRTRALSLPASVGRAGRRSRRRREARPTCTAPRLAACRTPNASSTFSTGAAGATSVRLLVLGPSAASGTLGLTSVPTLLLLGPFSAAALLASSSPAACRHQRRRPRCKAHPFGAARAGLRQSAALPPSCRRAVHARAGSRAMLIAGGAALSGRMLN